MRLLRMPPQHPPNPLDQVPLVPACTLVPEITTVPEEELHEAPQADVMRGTAPAPIRTSRTTGPPPALMLRLKAQHNMLDERTAMTLRANER